MNHFLTPEGKTNYQIINEHNEKTTVSLDKWVADILQLELNDVHASIQHAYNALVISHPYLTRREKGDIIREASIIEANKYPLSKKKVLGWNNEDLDFILKIFE